MVIRCLGDCGGDAEDSMGTGPSDGMAFGDFPCVDDAPVAMVFKRYCHRRYDNCWALHQRDFGVCDMGILNVADMCCDLHNERSHPLPMARSGMYSGGFLPFYLSLFVYGVAHQLHSPNMRDKAQPR
jgi:hypothetical protein